MNAKSVKVADKGIKTAIWDAMKEYGDPLTVSEIATILEPDGFLVSSVTSAVYALYPEGWFNRTGTPGAASGGYRYSLKAGTKRPVDEKIYVKQYRKSRKDGPVKNSSKEELQQAAQSLQDAYLANVPSKKVPIPPLKPVVVDPEPSVRESAQIQIMIRGSVYTLEDAKSMYLDLHSIFGNR